MTRPCAVARPVHPELPVFRIDDGGARSVVYCPGHFAVLDPAAADALQRLWAGERCAPADDLVLEAASWIEERARSALDARRARLEEPFAPECLTVYPSTRCNLGCGYCFASGERARPAAKDDASPVVSRAAVVAAARLVARSCAERGKRFTLVVHGGGEPTLHRELVSDLVRETRLLAREHGIGWFGYIATNGVLPGDAASWLGAHFDVVGLSCDGPPPLQDAQRPLRNGEPSSSQVERTASLVREAGGRLEVRATITPATVERQAEIVSYLHGALGATAMRFEPVYSNGRLAESRFRPADATLFVRHFLEAQATARALGCTLSFTGVRLDELHGPYCDVLRNALHLTPDGSATACFFCVDGRDPVGRQLRVGGLDEATGLFALDRERIDAHRREAARLPPACASCVSSYHCARSCPDRCSALERGWQSRVAREGDREESAEFRCRVQRELTVARILEAARGIASAGDAHEGVAPGLVPEVASAEVASAEVASAEVASASARIHPAPGDRDEAFEARLEQVSPFVDVASIREQWRAVRDRYRIADRRLPAPIWAERAFEDDGAKSWQALRRIVPEATRRRPFSIYVHVPFCEARCGFCDCHSLPLGRRREEAQARYAAALLREIDAWAEIVAHVPRVTTVHFGGGTPGCLDPDVLARIVERLRVRLRATSGTEWALESTSSLLTDGHLELLRGLGFTRLHVGVQTLEEPLRQRIGRRQSSAEVLEALARALRHGLVTTVDVVYGLPGQTLRGLLLGVTRLLASEVHGMSLYGFNRSRRNRGFWRGAGGLARDPAADYVSFQAAEQLLRRSGFRKNHFAHFAAPEDENLYSTHASRGEDLLALGASADGVFETYHYRHPEYGAFLRAGEGDAPVLEGGLAQDPLERRIHPAVASLLCGRIRRATLREAGVERLLARWTEAALVAADGEGGYFLTANGSWFVSEMIGEVREVASEQPSYRNPLHAR